MLDDASTEDFESEEEVVTLGGLRQWKETLFVRVWATFTLRMNLGGGPLARWAWLEEHRRWVFDLRGPVIDYEPWNGPRRRRPIRAHREYSR